MDIIWNPRYPPLTPFVILPVVHRRKECIPLNPCSFWDILYRKPPEHLARQAPHVSGAQCSHSRNNRLYLQHSKMQGNIFPTLADGTWMADKSKFKLRQFAMPQVKQSKDVHGSMVDQGDRSDDSAQPSNVCMLNSSQNMMSCGAHMRLLHVKRYHKPYAFSRDGVRKPSCVVHLPPFLMPDPKPPWLGKQQFSGTKETDDKFGFNKSQYPHVLAPVFAVRLKLPVSYEPSSIAFPPAHVTLPEHMLHTYRRHGNMEGSHVKLGRILHSIKRKRLWLVGITQRFVLVEKLAQPRTDLEPAFGKRRRW